MAAEKEDARAVGDGAGREEAQASEQQAHTGDSAAVISPVTPSFEDAEALAAAGYQLIPLRQGSKLPRDGRWTTRKYDSKQVLEEARRAGGNLGVRLRPCDLVIDVDPRNGGDESLDRLVMKTGLNLLNCPHVGTGGGGHHYYLLKPADCEIVGGMPQYPGIDFKKSGGQVVAPGAVHPETGRRYEADFFITGPNETPKAPEELLKELAVRRLDAPKGVSDAERWGELSPERLEKCLMCIPPDEFGEGAHDEWFSLMCACHHATAGAGREEFIAWSTQAAGYEDDAEEIGKRWDSLASKASSGRPTTIRHLYQVLARYGSSVPHPPPEEDFEVVQAEPEQQVPPQLRSLAQEWVWVADPEMFIRRRDLKRFTANQWKSLHDHLVEKSILSSVWKSPNFVPKFESLTYRPKAPEIIEDARGKTYNIWRESSLRPLPGDVSWFLDHMAFLVPDERERSAVLDYLAHLVQRPDSKIHFALLMYGVQGSGKSAIGELMQRIIGKANVSKPSNDEVVGQWTGWQERAQLAILEELMTLGRLEVQNRLKPLITEPMLRIHEKYQKPYSIDNYLNLLCFTNHKDALKIEQGDRRWFIVFSPAKPRDHLYYRRLFEQIGGEGAAHVADWLMSRDLSGFDAKGHAPSTSAKEQMRELSMGEAEAYLLELYREGAKPFDFDLVAAEDLRAALPTRIQTRTKRLDVVIKKFLEEIGAMLQRRNTSTRGTMAKLPKLQLWSLRNHDHWEAAGPTARAVAHDEYWMRQEFGEDKQDRR